jgi:hypothetical protein
MKEGVVKTTIVAGAMILGLAASAQAQPYFAGPRAYYRGVPPYTVDAIVRSTGLVPLGPPSRRGAAYVVVATDRYGRQMRVIVDAYAGEVISVRPMLAAVPYGAAPSVVYVPRGEALPPPIPPRAVPSARLAGIPPAGLPSDPITTGSIPQATQQVPPQAPPARTPLPRPRPVVAAIQAPVVQAPASQAPVPVVARPTAPEAPDSTPVAAPAPQKAVTVSPQAPAKPATAAAAPTLVPVAPLDE